MSKPSVSSNVPVAGEPGKWVPKNNLPGMRILEEKNNTISLKETEAYFGSVRIHRLNLTFDSPGFTGGSPENLEFIRLHFVINGYLISTSVSYEEEAFSFLGFLTASPSPELGTIISTKILFEFGYSDEKEGQFIEGIESSFKIVE